MFLVFGFVLALVSVFGRVLVSCLNNSRIYGEVLAGKMYLSQTAVDLSKAVIILLFIQCLLLLPVGVGVLCWVIVTFHTSL